jgi:predicted deacetylase
MRKLTACIVVSAVLSCFFISGLILYVGRSFDPQITVCPWPYGKEGALTVTCDDISTGYPLEYFTDIRELLDSHGLKATFFVIPYHGEWDLLTESLEFVDALHAAEESGHEIALHGYAHYENEFVCSPQEQETLLIKALDIMYQAGFSVKGFRAPCLQETAETPAILETHGFVYDTSYFGESGKINADTLYSMPSGHEYTWYISEEEVPESVRLVESEFLEKFVKGLPFSFVMHMKAVNEGGGMEVLDQLFTFISSFDVWNGTLLELVQWEKARKAVEWDTKKTLSGGEICFSSIPQGLAVDMVIPDSYFLEDTPPGVQVVSQQEKGHYRIFFEETFSQVILTCGLWFSSRTPELVREVAILSDSSDNPSDAQTDLMELLEAWEVPYRVIPVDSLLQEELLGKSSTLLLHDQFLHRPPSEKEMLQLFSLENRTIIFSGLDISPVHDVFLEKKREEEMEYITQPIACGKVAEGYRSCVYYDLKVVSGLSTYVLIDQLREDSPCGLYENLLIRTLHSLSRIPTRTPFLSLEIDDCGMNEIRDSQGKLHDVDIDAYENSLHLAQKYEIVPLYGFTTYYFLDNVQIESIFSLLKQSDVQVANHGFHHCLNFMDSHILREQILQANEDIQSLWGQAPRIILVPCHEMNQDAMKNAIRKTCIQYVGSLDMGYDFGSHEGVYYYERTSLQLYSNSIHDTPPFGPLFLYSHSLLPSFYAVTHVFNFIEKGAAYRYIDDAVRYLTHIGYQCSDTETLAHEDVFWSQFDMYSSIQGERMIVELKGGENLPKTAYTVHLRVYGSPSIEIYCNGYPLEPHIHSTDPRTYVTLLVPPEMLPHTQPLLP